MKRLARTRALRRALMIIGLVAIVILARSAAGHDLIASMKVWSATHPVLGMIVFSIFYVSATLLLVPGTFLTLAAGAIFGIKGGLVVSSASSSVGAALAFLIARHLARESVAAQAQASPRFRAIDRAIAQGGWKIVALLRLSLAIPFNFQNYLLGLTKIPFWSYLITSWITMIPGTLLFVCMGHLARGAATDRQPQLLSQWGLLVIGLVPTILVSVYVTALTKRNLLETQEESASVAHQPPDTESDAAT